MPIFLFPWDLVGSFSLFYCIDFVFFMVVAVLSTAHKTPIIQLCRRLFSYVLWESVVGRGQVAGLAAVGISLLCKRLVQRLEQAFREARPNFSIFIVTFFIYRHYKPLVFKFSTFREKNFQWPTIFNCSVVFTFTVSYLWHVYYPYHKGSLSFI
jgi:hypothetical protein